MKFFWKNIKNIGMWDRQSPKFIAAQFSVWGKNHISDFAEIEKRMKELTNGRFEFMSADTFFRLCRHNKSSC